MIDTFMALWNQDRRKRARQALLIFFLLCIGISLLLVVTKGGFQYQKGQTFRQQTAVVPTFGVTIVPNNTPTVGIVGGQPTSGATPNQPTPISTSTGQKPGATSTGRTPGATSNATPGATSTQSTPGTTSTQIPPIATPGQQPPTPTTQPCVPTPSGAASISFQPLSLFRAMQPLQHLDGGKPIITNTPTRSITPTPAHQPGWLPNNCTTSNSISTLATSDTLALLGQNIWLILLSSMLGTAIFYTILFAIKRRKA